ncbi:MAG: hypothetical protein ACP5IL_12920 [Syntrophobacteraceae bacterium]
MLTTTQSYVTYAGNGATTSFPYPFPVAEAASLQVFITNGNVSPPVSTALSPSQYSVTGIGNGVPGASNPTPGGVVTYSANGTPLATGWTITIQRLVPYLQDTTLQNQGGFYPQVVEAALDDVVMQTQQLSGQITNLQAQINQLAASEQVVNVLPATIQLPVSFAPNLSTQSLSSLSTTYLTANTSATVLNAFSNLTKGHNFKIIIDDAFTSIQFAVWGAGVGAGSIIGHQGQLVSFIEGDVLDCVSDGTYVYAIDSEPMAPAILSPVSGLVITNDTTTPNTKLSISWVSIAMANTLGGKLSQTWAVGPESPVVPVPLDATTLGPGGMDLGTLGPNTWYYVWAIGDGEHLNVLLSAASSWAMVNKTYIANYDYARLLGCVSTDGSAHLSRSHQYGNEFFFDIPQPQTLPANSNMANVVPTVAPQSHLGTTSYSYAVIGVDVNGGTTAAQVVTTNQGALTLSANNYITISWASVGAASYTVYRTASAGTPSTTGVIASGVTGTVVNDTGLSADGTSPPSVNTSITLGQLEGGFLPAPAVKAFFCVNGLQATNDSGFLAVSADGTNAYATLHADSGGMSLSSQFEVPVNNGYLWGAYSNISATALLARGFAFNL